MCVYMHNYMCATVGVCLVLVLHCNVVMQLLNVKENNMEEKRVMSTVISPSLSSTIRAFLSSRQDHSNIKYKCGRCKGQIFVV